MIIIDKTPYRSKTGEIPPLGLVQGMLKYGMSWQNRMKAQDVVIAKIEKQLDSNFALLRNVTLPNTDIVLPLVLIGPPGICLINVAHERGIYQARDDEWGTMVADRFIPARINQITRTATFGRVLQIYLDRQGFKGRVMVEPILMAADPGMQIESTRPAVRVVMSDALERFAASMSHARTMLDTQLGKDVLKAIMVGKPAQAVIPEPEPEEDTFSSSMGEFAFDDSESDQEAETPQATGRPGPQSDASQQSQKPKKSAKKKGTLGLTRSQLLIVGAALLFALCSIIGGAIFVLTLPNG
jgi:hypothetical protein